jgi:hypothetical protein
MMKRIGVVVLAANFALAAVAATAEMEANIQSIDGVNRVITLNNGMKLAWDEGTSILVGGRQGRPDDLKEGAIVKASFEERDGKNVARILELTLTPDDRSTQPAKENEGPGIR